MLQTDLNIWLQSFSSPLLTMFMNLVSTLGTSTFFTALFLVTMFAIDYRKGIVLTYFVLWAFLLNTLLKDIFALPRPADVDSAILLLDKGTPNLTPFSGFGARTFWEPLPPEVVIHFRAVPNYSFGFPSGHCAMSVVAWGVFALLFRKRTSIILAFTVIGLMPVSRMYLGKHFLADVLGGLLVGAAVLGVAVLFLRSRAGRGFFQITSTTFDGLHARQKLALGLPILLPLPFLLLPNVMLQSAILVGMALGAWMTLRYGMMPSLDSPGKRAALVGITLLFIVALSLIFMKPIYEVEGAGTAPRALMRFISALVMTAGAPIVVAIGKGKKKGSGARG